MDDGSTDGTGALAAKLAEGESRVRLVMHLVNRGYGAAVRTGIGAARMPYVLLTDADLQFDLADLGRLVPQLESADAVVGYRLRRNDPLVRRAAAAAWNRLVRTLYDLPFKDVDCAFKLFPRDAPAGARAGVERGAVQHRAAGARPARRAPPWPRWECTTTRACPGSQAAAARAWWCARSASWRAFTTPSTGRRPEHSADGAGHAAPAAPSPAAGRAAPGHARSHCPLAGVGGAGSGPPRGALPPWRSRRQPRGLLLRRRREEHEPLVAQLLLRRVRPVGPAGGGQAAGRPLAPGGEREALRLQRPVAGAAGGGGRDAGGAAALRRRAAPVRQPGGNLRRGRPGRAAGVGGGVPQRRPRLADDGPDRARPVAGGAGGAARARPLPLPGGAGDGPRLQREAVRGARCAPRPVPALHARLAHPVAPAERTRGRGGCAVRARRRCPGRSRCRSAHPIRARTRSGRATGACGTCSSSTTGSID